MTSKPLESAAFHRLLPLDPARKPAARFLQSVTLHCLAERPPKSGVERGDNHKTSKGWSHGQPLTTPSHPLFPVAGPVRLLERRENKPMTIQPSQIANGICRFVRDPRWPD